MTVSRDDLIAAAVVIVLTLVFLVAVAELLVIPTLPVR